MTTTAAMKISVWTFDMRHMVGRLYVDGLPPVCFTSAAGRQRHASSARQGEVKCSGAEQSAQRSDAHQRPPYSLFGSLWEHN
jgi:hypothetical protein